MKRVIAALLCLSLGGWIYGAANLSGTIYIVAAPYNAKCDVIATVNDGAISSSVNPTQFTSTAITFVAGDIGKYVVVAGAGVSGYPLSGKIVSVSGHTATLDTAASTTVATAAKWYYGSDDAAAINAAEVAASRGEIIVIPAKKCGFASTINATVNDYRYFGSPTLAGAGIKSTSLMALASMTNGYLRSSTFGYGGGINEITIDCFKLVTNCIYHEGGTRVIYEMVAAENALTAEWKCGDGTTGTYENTWRSISGETQSTYFTTAQRSTYNWWSFSTGNGCTDSYMIDLVMANAATANINDPNGGNNHYIHPHVYGYPITPSNYGATYGIVSGANQIDNPQIDNAVTSGIYISAVGYASVIAPLLNNASVPTNFIEIATSLPGVIVMGAHGLGIASLAGANVVVQDGSVGANNCVSNNQKASYTASC